MQKIGKYEILQELGSGSMGTVYRARDPFIERLVALKTIRLQGFSTQDMAGYRERFFREAQAAGKLRHPGIVTIFEVGVDEPTSTPFIAMLLLEGPSLDKLVNDAPAPLSLEQSLHIVRRLAEALDHAHANGVVHRDIKPANIIVTPQDGPVITDFGVARVRKSQLTVQGELVGTPAFMSPEQVQGDRVDGRADLFSLGVILYWMLTRQRPFNGDMTEVMFQIVSKEPVPPTRLNPALPAAVDAVVARALAKQREARYQSGKEFAADLVCLLEGRAPQAAEAPTAPVPRADATIRLAPEESPAAQLRQRATDERVPGEAPPLATRVPESREAGLAGAWHRIPVAAKAIALVAVLVLLALGLMKSGGPLQTPQSTLYIELHHNFRAGTFELWADGRALAKESLVADETRGSGRTVRYVGRFTHFVSLDAGRRTVRVRVTSPDDSFDQSREISGNFAEQQQRTLGVQCDARRGTLQLILR